MKVVQLFDEGKGNVATDSSGNENDGKLMGAPKWVDGKFGGGLEFKVPGDRVHKRGEMAMTKKILSCILFISAMVLLLTGSAWARQDVSLNGEWEFQFSHSDNRPAEGEWDKIPIPSHVGLREEQYIWYRRSFTIPESMSGQRVFLKFGGVKFVSEVRLNGKAVGGHYGGWEPFEFEVTDNCNVGGENQLVVRVTDARGIVDQELDYSRRAEFRWLTEQAQDSIMAPVGSRPDRAGIWQDVSLESRSDVYIDDVFIKTSVRKKTIEVDCTLVNLSDRRRVVQLGGRVYGGEDPVLTLENASADVLPRSTAKVTLKKAWPSPKLWSPESPCLYSLASGLMENGRQIDGLYTRFGFREFWIDGIYFVLNGTRIKFLATGNHPRRYSPTKEATKELTKEAAQKMYSDIRSANCMAIRLHANVWPEVWYETADEVGMLLIQESALWGPPRNYALSRDEFWENTKGHLRGMIRRDKNHPSVVMYSIENEILLNGGAQVPGAEERVAELGRLVKSIDPTRPIMFDGDVDPMGVADVENLHYPHEYTTWNLWPNTAYWVDEKMLTTMYPRREWQWERRKPLYIGEFMVISYPTPDPYAIFIGDDAYQDYRTATARVQAIAWSMQLEAFRAAEVSGMCPWTVLSTGDFPNLRSDAVKRAYEPNAAFMREHDSRFYEGEEVARTVYLYNDTLHAADLTLIWELKDGNSIVDSGKQMHQLDPAQRVITKIRLHIPHVQKRSPLSLSLQVKNGVEPAFRDEKQYWAFPRRKLNIQKGTRIAVYTADAKHVELLEKAEDVEHTDLTSLSEIPPDTQLLIIGPHALDYMECEDGIPVVGDESAPSTRLADFVRGGGTVFVMQQSVYPSGLLPASLTDHSSTITFRRAPDSDILKSIIDEDLKTWRGDHLVSEHDVSKPTGGAFRAIIDSGGGHDGLLYVPLMEVLSGRGRYILCQLSLTRAQEEPIAQILFENIVNHALKPPAGRVRACIVQHKLNIKRAISSVGAVCDDLTGKLNGKRLKDYGVIIAEGGAPEVSANVQAIREFVRGGGKVLLHCLTPGDLAKLNLLFPEKISLKRSASVPVNIFQADGVISGLANHDLYWQERSRSRPAPLLLEIMDYAVTKALPEPEKCREIEAEDMEVEYGNPSITQNGTFMSTNAAVAADVTFPESAEYIFGVRASGTSCDGIYPKVTLLVDGVQNDKVMLNGPDREIYIMMAQVNAGEHRIALAFTNDKHDPARGEDRNLSLDNLIYAKSQPTAAKPLLTPAALAKVPLGKGFYLIDQINWHDLSTSADKAARYLTNLLVNLGVPFAEEVGTLDIPGAEMKPAEGLKGRYITGAVARLAANGSVFSDIRFASSREYILEVKARGTEAAGEYPNIRLAIDGEIIGDQMLHYPGWETLTFKAFVDAGKHRVSLAFTNDYYKPPEDRNLDIGRLRIR